MQPCSAQAQEYVPEVGQEGKDVVWVPTAQTLVDKMLDMAEVKPGDYVIDLGSGDGRTVIAAAKRGAKALGIEYNARMVELAKRNAARAGVADRATFVEGDIFASDFSEATVLTLFLLPEINLRLLPTILNMKPGTRVVSNSFDMGSWKPDQTAEVTRDCKTYCQALLWIVPAKVEGTWQMQLVGEPEGRRRPPQVAADAPVPLGRRTRGTRCRPRQREAQGQRDNVRRRRQSSRDRIQG